MAREHDTEPNVRRLELLRSVRPALMATLALSIVANLLLLVSPVYMLQIYDRVVTSGSFDALLWLTVIALFLLAVYGAAEAGRRRTLAMAGARFEHEIVPKVFKAFEEHPGAGMELERDLRRVHMIRGMFDSGAFLPWVDLPFTPLFVAILFLVHPWLGVIGIVGAALVLAIAVLAEVSTRRSGGVAASKDAEISAYASGLSRQRSAMVAMGLGRAALERWRRQRIDADSYADASGRASNAYAASSRAVRQGLQIGILAAGAALALSQQISMGAIVAGSIILARALGPIDQIVGGWRQTAQARRALDGLLERLDTLSEQGEVTRLPRPEATVTLDRLAVAAPGAEQALIRPFTVTLSAGDIVVLLGSNGSGKTCLLQTIAGAWKPHEGAVLLGGRSIHDWQSDDRGRHVGYVPQAVEIFPGTIRDNIARFGEAADEDVFRAAQKAGAHEFILSLPDGYDTLAGPGGRHLSAGQSQLLGLARALYGDPILLLLDEPTANLDSAAAAAFLGAIERAARDGALVVAATHDLRLVKSSQTALVVRQGSVMAADSQRYLEAMSSGEGKREQRGA